MKNLLAPRAGQPRPGVLTWAALLLLIAAGAAALAPAEAHGAPPPAADEAPGPLLRATYKGLRAIDALPPRYRRPDQEAVLSYITAHERRPILAPPADTWADLLRDTLTSLRRAWGARAPG